MAMLFLKCVLIFLASYGLYELITELFIWLTKPDDSRETVVVVKVLNHEESIEAIIRNLILKLLKNSSLTGLVKIVIVDCGSVDDTVKIVRRLCNDYSFISYTTLEKYNKAKNEMMK